MDLKELDARMEELMSLKLAYDNLKQKSGEIYATMEQKKQELASILEDHGRDSYKSPAGTFNFKYIENYRVPKDEESRQKFFGYLRERGILDDMMTVNSATLNAWAKTEEGDIPGITKSEPYIKASVRKA